jgi:hypothetical protein
MTPASTFMLERRGDCAAAALETGRSSVYLFPAVGCESTNIYIELILYA